MKFVKWMESRSKVVKVLLALPIFNSILWNIVRIIKSVEKKSVLGTILGILLILVGWGWVMIMDIITIIAFDRILWFD